MRFSGAAGVQAAQPAFDQHSFLHWVVAMWALDPCRRTCSLSTRVPPDIAITKNWWTDGNHRRRVGSDALVWMSRTARDGTPDAPSNHAGSNGADRLRRPTGDALSHGELRLRPGSMGLEHL
jgi:hypothetical protein